MADCGVKERIMTETASYDDIRAYYDEEIPAATSRIADNPLYVPVSAFIFPGMSLEEARAKIRACKSTYELQQNVMYPAIKRIADLTIDQFSFSGIGNVAADRGSLFISNHRDIVLDAFLLQYVFFSNSLPTSDITYGDNLSKPDFVVDICRSNKMTKVIRKDDSTLREFLENSRHLAEYIRLRITGGNSVWIAQRNGRTKDGCDMTEQGLLKMFSMSGEGDFANDFSELHITPVSISYEYEPCDIFKTAELAKRLSGQPYRKAENEDFNSILHGIKTPKGNVNITICEPVTDEELIRLAALSKTDAYKGLMDAIDRRICGSYMLHATNFIAHDILSGEQTYASKYNDEQKAKFMAHLANAEQTLGGIWEVARPIFLGIYANPVDRKIEWTGQAAVLE